MRRHIPPYMPLKAPTSLRGTLLARKPDGNGVIEVWQNEKWRWLIFSSQRNQALAVQSLMHREHPSALALPYMQALCLSTCYVQADSPRVLQFGLGAAAINRFLSAHTLVDTLHTVEKSQVVVDVCHSYFGFPANNTIDIASADKWLASCITSNGNIDSNANLDGQAEMESQAELESHATFESHAKADERALDIAIVDLYGDGTTPAVMQRDQFFRAVASRLTCSGLVAMNLPHPDTDETKTIFAAMRLTFRHLHFFSLPGYDNVVLLASREPLGLDRLRLERLNGLVSLDLFEIVEQSVQID